jgi:hypothetical protein
MRTAVGVNEPPRRVLTAEYEPDINRVKLVFAPAPGSCDYATFEASRNNGESWAPVRGCIHMPLTSAGIATVYDYVAPLGRLSWYRVAPYFEIDGVLYAHNDMTSAVAVVPHTNWELR